MMKAIEDSDWKGVGYYGPIQSENRIKMVFVCNTIDSYESLCKKKAEKGVMTVRYFINQYDTERISSGFKE